MQDISGSSMERSRTGEGGAPPEKATPPGACGPGR